MLFYPFGLPRFATTGDAAYAVGDPGPYAGRCGVRQQPHDARISPYLPPMPFFTEPDHYKKTILSDLQGVWKVLTLRSSNTPAFRTGSGFCFTRFPSF
jgi:hypothetical protein